MIYDHHGYVELGVVSWMGPLKSVNGDDRRWLYRAPADGRKETPRDNYVLQLQPFNLYPISHNRYETVSL